MWMKKLFIGLLVIILLLVGAVFTLPIVLSSDAAREQFSARVSDISGMNINLGGPVSFSIFPDLGLVAKQVSFATPEGDLSASVAKIVAGVKIASVLSGNLEITGLSLNQPEIILDSSKKANQQNVEAESNSESPDNSDPFAAAVELLERLSLNRFQISNGKLISRSGDGSQSTISDIDMILLAPSLDGEIKLTLSADQDGQKIATTVKLAALRPILKRQPARLGVELKMSPPPHPALADLTISGDILLAEDGSYQISDGLLTSLGQPLRLDVLYRPEKRPYANLSIEAQNVDLGIIEKITGSEKAPQNQPATPATNGPAPDIGPLLQMDADIRIKIGRFALDGAEVKNIDLKARLKDGNFTASLGNASIANGAIAAQIAANLNSEVPGAQGSISATSLAIASLAKLANVDSPLSGALGLNIGYAFSGLDPATIKSSFNIAGTVSLTNGALNVPELASLGPNAAKISRINVEANIKHVQKPIDIKARMNWNGEAVQLNALVSPHSFIINGGGPVTASLDSAKISADYSGTVNLNGSLVGNAKVSTRSLDQLLAWLGQGANNGLKAFSYSSTIALDTNKFAFDSARISLNGITARGRGSFGLKGKPNIITTLAFDVLDIAALTGGGTAKADSGGNTSQTTSSGDTPIDLSPLKSFDANITLSANKLGYGKVMAGPVNTTLVIKNGIARFKLPQTPFYGGSIFADINADGSSDTSAIAIDAKLSDIEALPLFRDAAEFDRLEGKMTANLKVNGAGNTTRTLSKSLAGAAGATFSNGAIRGIDIAKIYNNLASVLTSGFKENASDKTTFTALGLSFIIDKGVATTNDIKLIGPLVRMDGAGKVDIGEQSIDMRLNPRVVASATGQGGNYDVGGVGIPVIIKGPLSKPQIYPDLSELLKNPQAALNSLSKLGLNIKGLDIKNLGKGNLDIKKLATEKLKLDKLDKIAGKGAGEKVGKVVGDLLANKKPDQNGQQPSTTESVVGALVNQLVKPNNPQNQPAATPPPVENAAPANGGQSSEDLPKITGRIAVPTPNPRRTAAVDEKPKTTREAVIEKVAPKLKLPVDDEVTKKGLNILLDKVLE